MYIVHHNPASLAARSINTYLWSPQIIVLIITRNNQSSQASTKNGTYCHLANTTNLIQLLLMRIYYKLPGPGREQNL